MSTALIKRFPCWTTPIVALTLSGLLSLGSSISSAQDAKAAQEKPGKSDSPVSEPVEIRLTDDSNLKVLLREENIELHTAYGKLVIPISDVIRIEFGLRIAEDVQKRIAEAIQDLGHADFKRRQTASSTLLSQREKAYPALLQASKNKDLEVARRAEQVLKKLREIIPEESLELPATDIVHTGNSKIAGHIKATSFRVGTLPFGDQQLKLADVRTLKTQTGDSANPPPTANVIPNPGTLGQFQGQIGQTLAIQVTAPLVGGGGQGFGVPGFGQGGIYGTNIYTLDSNLALATVHAGALKPGQTGVVRVTILGPQAGFQASVQNGLTSSAYGPWPGFRIEVPRNAGRKNAN